MRAPASLALILSLVAAACADPAAEAPGDEDLAAAPAPVAAPPPLAHAALDGFAHQADADLFGYYFPVTEVRVGDLLLSHLFIGSEAEFRAWEAPRRAADAFAPVMFQFDDTGSPLVGNELGGEGYSVTERVPPDAYAVSAGHVRFAGRHPTLGEVTFDGRLDGEALAAARAGRGASDGPVLTGVLVVGDRTFEGQSFRWFAGD